MAIYHLSAQIISRKAGRSATAAAAYRAGVEIVDERTGEIHDYRRKAGVEHAEIVMPSSASDWAPTRAELWNAAELKNKRADAQVAREFVVALPDELPPAERQRLAVDFAREIADRYSIAADVAIHAPSRHGDDRNHHAHILTTTNRVEGHKLGNKARELDLVAHNMAGKVGQANEIDRLRERWAALTNERLRDAGHEARVDHRSHAERGVEAVPTQHLGPTATAIERRTGQSSAVRIRQEQEAVDRLARAREAAELDRQGQALDHTISDVSAELAAALAERDQLQAQQRQAEWRQFLDEKTRQVRQEAEKARQAAQAAQEAERDRQEAQAAEQARQQAQEAAWQQELARVEQEEERERQLRRITAEIQRLRPPPVRELAERDPAVIRTQVQCADLERRHTEAKAAAAQARDAAEAWREAHKFQVWFHSREIGYSPALRELEQQHAAADVQARTLSDRMAQADDELYAARAAAQRRISAEQVLVLARIAELEQQRLELERAVLEQQRRRAAEFEALRQEPRGRVHGQDQGLGL